MKLTNIKKTYHNKNSVVEALKGITLDLSNKGITVLLGPSGSGKSTLLNILSGQDRSFEGELVRDVNLDYITQDFRLFEAMSVIENLRIISNDQPKIETLLKQFSLLEHANKKVKKCSNGQKKRVQFIRALLQSPGLLLCDEPTAALDHENAELLMHQLKEISQNIPIFLVTHDIALAEEYADRILTMDAGLIVKDEIVNKKEQTSGVLIQDKKNLVQTIKAVLLQFKSRPFEAIFLACVALVLSFGLFVCTQVFGNVNNQTQSQYIWEKSINRIETKINDSNKIIGDDNSPIYSEIYEKFDVYKDSDIKKVVDEVEEILAVEAFYDVYLYDDVARTLNINEWQAKSFETGYTRYYNTDIIEYTKQPAYYPFAMSHDQFIEKFISEVNSFFTIGDFKDSYNLHYFDEYGQVINRPINSVDEITEEEISASIPEFERTFIVDNESKNTLHPYEIVKGKQLPVMIGSMPQAKNEVLLDLNAAELIRFQYEFESLEAMIGQTIEVSVPLAQGRFMRDNQHRTVHELITIVGISNYANEDQRQIFFLEGGVKETLLKNIVNEGADVSYTVVNFILDTDSNFEAVCAQINELMPIEQNTFMLAVNANPDKANTPTYQNPQLFLLYSVLAIVSILVILVIYYVMIRNRYRKEKTILSVYGYSVDLESVIRVGVLYLVTNVIWLLSSASLIKEFNKIAKSLHYDSFLNVNHLWMVLMAIVAYVIHLLVEKVLRGRLHD